MDKNDSYFLLPEIVEDRSFSEQITFLGKKTNHESITGKDL